MTYSEQGSDLKIQEIGITRCLKHQHVMQAYFLWSPMLVVDVIGLDIGLDSAVE